MTKFFKKTLIFLVMFMTFPLHTLNFKIVNAKAMEYAGYQFLDISDEESIKFVEYHNIDIPKKIENSPNLGSITSEIIKRVANNPNQIFTYNYGEMQVYAETIQKLVAEYSDTNYGISLLSTTTYTLQNNTVQDSNGNWVTSGGAYNSRWYKYNCYAYSINRIEQPQFYSSGDYIQYQPGDMSGSGSFRTSETIYELATVVKNDLLAMGFTNISLTTTIPSITDDQELICIRMGETDYHFMRYDKNTNAWYHKPGRTAILKYNYVPINSLIWNCEYSLYGTEDFDSELKYDSDIYFIKYDKNKVNITATTTNLSYDLTVKSGKDSILEIKNSNSNKQNFAITSQDSMTAILFDNEMG